MYGIGNLMSTRDKFPGASKDAPPRKIWRSTGGSSPKGRGPGKGKGDGSTAKKSPRPGSEPNGGRATNNKND